MAACRSLRTSPRLLAAVFDRLSQFNVAKAFSVVHVNARGAGVKFLWSSGRAAPMVRDGHTVYLLITPTLMKLLLSFFTALVFTLTARAVAPAWSGNPMIPGIAALTCTSSGNPSVAGQNEHVLVFLDVRDPIGCAATPIVSGTTEWALNLTRLYWPAPAANDWSVRNMGEVFGVDVGVGNASPVFVSAAGPKPCNWGGPTIWNNRDYNTAASNAGNGGEVWRVDGVTHLPFLLANLPNHKGYFQGAGGGGVYSCINGNSFVGLGQVSVNTNAALHKLYVSNMDDGKIYVINNNSYTSVPLCVFDHGATQPGPALLDNPNLLYTQKGRRVFGLEYHPQANRLFYALRNALNQDEIWSIGLDATGCPTGVQCLEYVSQDWSTSGLAGSAPGDIQFSADGCRMLITQISIREEMINCTSITPAFAGPVSQLIPFHYAHTSTPYELTRTSNAACGGWTLAGQYSAGIPMYGGPTNSIAGDYGFGSLVSTPAIDSVVFVADVIRQLAGGTYKFGLQINPLGDFTRANGPANFDIPLLTVNGNAPVTKIQLNDVDILHTAPCMKIVTGTVNCPLTPSGKHTVTINITNTSNVPYYGISLTNCAGMPMLPGQTPITPLPLSPSPITLGNPLLPGQSTGPLTICLPGIPPAGGDYCFCVQLMGEVEGSALCTQMVCVHAPVCLPPCATITPQQVVCDHVSGNYLFSLCITNLQALPITSIKFTPCTDTLGNPLGPVPTGPFVVNPALPNGGSQCFPFVLPAPNTQGGQYCFSVTLCAPPKPGDSHDQVICNKKICLQLPPCQPPCMELTPSNIQCPQIAGAPYVLSLKIKNLSGVPVTHYNLALCPNPPPNCTPAVPAGGLQPIPGAPLLPGACAIVSVSLPGLPCTGGKYCFCVTLLQQLTGADPANPQEGPLDVICQDVACVQLPACPCPPCLHITPGTVLCPAAINGPYAVAFILTNLQATPAAYYGLSSCAVPPGFTPVQPNPLGLQLIPGGPVGLNGTSGTITITLPVPLTGGAYCFCITLFGADQQTQLCKERYCVTLPSCRCAEITNIQAQCVAANVTTVTFDVTNFTNLYPSPYTFASATISPSTGFSPSSVAVSIAPAGTSTITTNYSGPSGPICVNVILADVTRTRCCTVKLCFTNPACLIPPPDSCQLANEYICENGAANLLMYICNNSPTPRCYTWTLSPATVPGCSGTLTPTSFTPASGITPTIGANSCVGIASVVNSTLTAGQCAGFKFCFTPKNWTGGTRPPTICCIGKIVCPGHTDPCIVIGDARTVVRPGGVIGVPVIIKNPTDVVLTVDLVPQDADGVLTFSSLTGLITDEAPYTVTLQPGEMADTTFLATASLANTKVGTGIIIIAKPCVGRYLDDHYYGVGVGSVLYGPSIPASHISVPIQRAAGPLVVTSTGLALPFAAEPGLFYDIPVSTSLMFSGSASTGLPTFVLPPVAEGLIISPSGEFTSPAGLTSLGLTRDPMLPKEFYEVRWKCCKEISGTVSLLR